MLSISRRELRELRKVIQMNGQFNIVITVDAPVVGQLQLAPTQDLGPANNPYLLTKHCRLLAARPPYKVTNLWARCLPA